MSLKSWAPYLALFGSFGTLVCCALPAAFVALGAGATLASLLGHFPQLIWLSQNKEITFAISGLFIALGYFNLWRTRNDPCPLDPRLAKACRTGKRVSWIVLSVSALLFVVGGVFAFVVPRFLD